MANKKFIKEGVFTTSIEIADALNESQIGSITFENGAITISTNLTVNGTTTSVNTTDLNIADNTVLLNKNETGAGISLGTAGIEIERGTESNARFVYDEAVDAFVVGLANGSALPIVSNITPSASDHLTNKNYVDTTIASELVLLNIPNVIADLTDVDPVTGSEVLATVPATGIVFNSLSSTWEPKIIPPGISQISINTVSDNDISVAMPTTQGGPSPTFNVSLKPTTVIANSYEATSITVDANGRITFAEDGNVWKTFTADSGTINTATGPTDTMQITGGTGISTLGLSTTRIDIKLDDTSVVANTYTNATIAVDAQGRITFASSGTINQYKTFTGNSGSTTANSPTDTLNINGGTGLTSVATSDTVTIAMDNTSVTPGMVTNPSLLEIDAQGRITNAVSGPSDIGTPTGAMIQFGGSSAPSGWLLCDGASVSRTTFAALFAVLSTTYGSTSGTTFNVPDMVGKFALGEGGGNTRGQTGGSQTHTLTIAEMPSHTHTLSMREDGGGSPSTGHPEKGTGSFKESANISSAGSNVAHSIMPPFSVFNYIIKI